MADPFLSASWYRISGLKPRLRDHAGIDRHRYRGVTWHVLNDPLTRQVHRLSPAAYHFVARMNGRRTIDEIWVEVVSVLDAEAPSQDDILQLLAQLHAADLLQSDATSDVEELFERAGKRRRSKVKQKLGNPLSIRIPLCNPDAFLSATIGLVRPLFGRVGIVLWLALVVPALALAALNAELLAASWSDQMISAQNLVLTSAIYVVIKTLHELGHGYAVKAFGGPVPEAGLMFLVAVPLPYVDATAANRFRSKGRRMVVAGAGILVELGIAAIALYVWLLVEPGLVRAMAYDAMIVAGISTLVFNANPLLRFDGYFVLADALEIPNLASRANTFWQHLADTRLLGVKERPLPGTAFETFWFAVYAPAAFGYRLLIVFTLALFLASHYFFIGVALAAWGIFSGVAKPVFKILKHVVASPKV